MKRALFCLLLYLPSAAFALSSSLQTLYYTLDPSSVKQHLAFYELYPETQEGKEALDHAWKLLTGNHAVEGDKRSLVHMPSFDLNLLLRQIMRNPLEDPVTLGKEELQLIQTLSQDFANRKLQGAHVWTKEEVLLIPSEEIDLARGLLIDQLFNVPDAKEKILQYEAVLDLMALQIKARLPEKATSIQKLHAMNAFIFQEMQFRFPPHSVYAKDVDLYTFLSSVIDSREGVCLGVCILYLSLAQRLDLPLEVITPPGHIYVRYHEGNTLINIETTARGIDLPTETYLSLHTRKLNQRTVKEVIGMAFMNGASVFLSKEDYKQAAFFYEKAQDYLPNDPLINMLLGCTYLFLGKNPEGMKLLKAYPTDILDEAVSKETIPEDLLKKKVGPEGVKILFLPVDETRESILKKQQELLKILKTYPEFRAGIFMLATTWLQLGRYQEAIAVLKHYHKLDPNYATVEYYLAALCAERLQYEEAWDYLKNAERLTKARNHNPKALKALRQGLKALSPEKL